MIDTAITLTLHKRPQYTLQVLNGLIESIRYCSIKPPLFCCIDYINQEVVDIVRNIDQSVFEHVNILINDPPIGCNNNTLKAWQYGFQNYDRIIHLEDDTVPCIDAIQFLLSNLDQYHADPNIFSISGYNKTEDITTTHLEDTETVNHFTCWGIGLWKNKSDILIDNWIQHSDRHNRSMSWYSHINDNIIKKNSNMLQVRPLISRIQNIGAEEGSWVPSCFWHYHHHRSPYTSNDLIIV